MAPVDPGARARGAGALRGQGPRQRARVHRASQQGALPALCARGHPQRSRGAGGLEPYRPLALGSAVRRARAARPHAAGPARRRHPHLPAEQRSAGRAEAAGGEARARRGGVLGRRGRRGRGAAPARPRARPDRQLRGQADRLEGSRPVVRRLAAGGGEGARRQAGDRRIRHLPRGPEPLGRGAPHQDMDALRDIAARGRELEGGPGASSST